MIYENNGVKHNTLKWPSNKIRELDTNGNDEEKDIHKRTNISGATKVELKDLSPYSIGQLISLWENKTIFNSIFWNTNAFDQWGVELGKINTQKQL